MGLINNLLLLLRTYLAALGTVWLVFIGAFVLAGCFGLLLIAILHAVSLLPR
jgi:hypothetical protein